MLHALRHHWPEYLAEAGGLAAMMLVLALAVTAAEVPLIPALGALPPLARRGLEALAGAATVTAMVYSPWGRQSGAHFNPALTVAFTLMRRMRAWDAVFYMLAQIAGGLAGLLLGRVLLGSVLRRPPVLWLTIVPGSAGDLVAFLAEFSGAFVLMSVLLLVGGVKRIAALTGLAAGVLMFAFLAVEAPVSGFSLNPARSLATALPSGIWTAWWVYLLASPLGMAAAALVNREAHLPSLRCAKLLHDGGVRCIHCGYVPPVPGMAAQPGATPCRTADAAGSSSPAAL
ncbi:MIP/aquaporin family protein [Rhodopila globiformis]|nr:aquaporin [Rhodopila globiformis]